MADRSNARLNEEIESKIRQWDGTIFGASLKNMYENGTSYEGMRYWTGTTLRWRRQRRPMKMEQDFFTRCSSTNWIITSTDTPENLRIRWIA